MESAASAEVDEIDQKADRIVRDVPIPPCPEILTKLLRESREEDPDIRRIGKMVESDVALAAASLKLVNSPFFGLRVKASSIQQAVTYLGLIQVTRIVTGLLLRNAFSDGTGMRLEPFWNLSLSSALISAFVARQTGHAEPGVAYTYALFRDCGMPVMLGKMKGYAEILDGSAVPAGERTIDVEDKLYGTNHARIGTYFARSWHLPESVCRAILQHHCVTSASLSESLTDMESCALIAVGMIAEELYYRSHGESSRDWALAGNWALEQVELSEADLADYSGQIAGLLKGY